MKGNLLLILLVSMFFSLSMQAQNPKLKKAFNGKNLKCWLAPENNIWWTADDGVLSARSGPDKTGSIQIGESGSLKRDMTCSPYIPGKGYPVEAEDIDKLFKPSDWNTIKVRAVGNKYTTWLNGQEVMNYQSTDGIAEGPIGLQLHPNREMGIDFRNIRIGKIKS